MSPMAVRGAEEVMLDDHDQPDAGGGRAGARPAASATRSARPPVVWQREMIRFGQDRARIVSSLVQPLLFLFVLGTGLSSLVSAPTGGVDFRTFLFPGVLAMSVLFTAAFSGISMVWDREFGFLREMLVAPVSDRRRSWSASASAAPPWPPCRASSSWPSPAWSACPTTR